MKILKNLAIVLLLLSITGCSKIANQINELTDTGSVTISGVISSTPSSNQQAAQSIRLLSSNVKAGKITLQRGTTTKVLDMIITDTQAIGNATELAVGLWSVTIELMDSANDVIYSGSSTFEVIAGEETVVTVILTAQTGDANIVIDLPQEPTHNYSPSAISPDGTRCVTVRHNTLYITNLITGGAQSIYSSAERINCASWSMDGTRIVFSRYNVASICSINVLTGTYGETSVQRMYFNPNIMDVKESPYEPGKYYYVTQTADLYLSGNNTPIAIGLVASGYQVDKISLSPTSRTLYYVSDYGIYGGSLTRIDLVNGSREIIPVDSIRNDIRDLYISNDGTKAILERRHFGGFFTKNYSMITLNTKNEGYIESYTLPQKNTAERELRLLGFSPNNESLYFKQDILLSGAGSAVKIYKYDQEDKTLTGLTNPGMETYLGSTLISQRYNDVPNTHYAFSLVITNSSYEQIVVDMDINTRLADASSSTVNIASNYLVTLKKTGAQYGIVMQDAFEHNDFSRFANGHSFVYMTIKTTSLQVLTTYSTNVNFDPTFVEERNYAQTTSIKKVRIICDNASLKELMKREVIEQIVKETLDK